MTKITDEKTRAAAYMLHETNEIATSLSDTSCGLHITITRDALPVAHFMYEDKKTGERRAITILGRLAMSLDEVYRVVGVLNEMVKYDVDPHIEAHGLLIEKLVGGWRPTAPCPDFQLNAIHGTVSGTSK